MNAPFIPVNEPDLSGNEKSYLIKCVETGWISSEGPFVTEFEEKFAAFCNRKHGIAVSNGTTALVAAFQALGLSKGDEVIMPAFTIISCASAIIEAGLKPVLVDAEAGTWNMNPEKLEEKITSRTKAILVVHIYGLPCEMDRIEEIAKKHDLQIVEDAAEMHGQNYRRRPCGSFGRISIFSFYANKIITTGEGGMIVTDDDHLAERCRCLRNLCFMPKRRFVHEELGHNFRLTNVQAALGVAQLERIEELIAKKRRMGKLYTELLDGVEGLELPLSSTSAAENIFWVYGVVLDDFLPFDAAEVMRRLQEHGVGTRPFFWGMHEQPVLQEMGLFHGEKYPVTERIARRGFYLPSGLAVTEAQQMRSVDALKEAMRPV